MIYKGYLDSIGFSGAVLRDPKEIEPFVEGSSRVSLLLDQSLELPTTIREFCKQSASELILLCSHTEDKLPLDRSDFFTSMLFTDNKYIHSAPLRFFLMAEVLDRVLQPVDCFGWSPFMRQTQPVSAKGCRDFVRTVLRYLEPHGRLKFWADKIEKSFLNLFDQDLQLQPTMCMLVSDGVLGSCSLNLRVNQVTEETLREITKRASSESHSYLIVQLMSEQEIQVSAFQWLASPVERQSVPGDVQITGLAYLPKS